MLITHAFVVALEHMGKLTFVEHVKILSSVKNIEVKNEVNSYNSDNDWLTWNLCQVLGTMIGVIIVLIKCCSLEHTLWFALLPYELKWWSRWLVNPFSLLMSAIEKYIYCFRFCQCIDKGQHLFLYGCNYHGVLYMWCVSATDSTKALLPRIMFFMMSWPQWQGLNLHV